MNLESKHRFKKRVKQKGLYCKFCQITISDFTEMDEEDQVYWTNICVANQEMGEAMRKRLQNKQLRVFPRVNQ